MHIFICDIYKYISRVFVYTFGSKVFFFSLVEDIGGVLTVKNIGGWVEVVIEHPDYEILYCIISAVYQQNYPALLQRCSVARWCSAGNSFLFF